MSSRLINSKLLSVLHASFGKLYVGIHDQEEVLVMDAEGGALLQRVETPVMSIASCDGLFACGTDSGHIRLFVEEKDVVVKKPTMAAQEDGNTTVVLEEKTLKGPRFLPAMHAAYLREYESVSGVQINIKQAPILSLTVNANKLVATGPEAIVMEEKNPAMPHLLALDKVNTVISHHLVADYVVTLSENGAITIGLFGDASDIYQLTPELGKQKYFYGQRYVSGTWQRFQVLLPNGNILIFRPKKE